MHVRADFAVKHLVMALSKPTQVEAVSSLTTNPSMALSHR